MNGGFTLLATGQVQVTTPGGAAADEYRVMTFGQEFFKAGYIIIEMGGDPQIQNKTNLFIQHFFRQPERGNLASDKAAGRDLVVEQVHLIS